MILREARVMVSKINFDNQLRWFQFQIVRNSLQTNVIVSHFILNISKTCSYCRADDSEELISHLFWFCPYVANFLRDVFSFFSDLGIELNPTRNHFLFWDPDHLAYSLKNFIFLILKKYIWREKFRVATLSLVGYKTMLKKYIYDLVYMLKYREIPDKVNEWNEMLDHL